MNVYEAMRKILADGGSPDYVIEKLEDVINELVDAYDELAPDWSTAPEWAQWATLFDNGKRIWWELDPVAFVDSRGDYAWREKDGRIGRATSDMTSPLPIGIDWRLCKWQRPEVK